MCGDTTKDVAVSSGKTPRSQYIAGVSESRKARKILGRMAKNPDHPMMVDEMYEICYGKKPDTYFIAKTRMYRVLKLMKDRKFLVIYNIKAPCKDSYMVNRSRRMVYTISDEGRLYLKTVNWTNLKTRKPASNL